MVNMMASETLIHGGEVRNSSKPARAQGDVVNIYDERLARRLRKGIGMRWTRVLGSQARKDILILFDAGWSSVVFDLCARIELFVTNISLIHSY
jgi:hypothetical protein